MQWYFKLVDILEQLKSVEQRVGFKVLMKSSFKYIMSSENFPMDELLKGVSVSANVSLIKNLKKMLFGLLKDENFALKKTLARVSPVLLL